MNAPLTLTQLAAAWRQAKADEQAANARRLEVEKSICAVLPASGPEAIEKAEVDGVVVKVTYKVSRSVDTKKLQADWSALSPNAQKAFRWKADVDARAMRALQDMLPDEYRMVADFITTKDAKPSVEIADVEEA